VRAIAFQEKLISSMTKAQVLPKNYHGLAKKLHDNLLASKTN
jgi:hypothetical protein